MNNFKLSERGYSHLMKFEGLRTKAYKLSGENFYTIGMVIILLILSLMRFGQNLTQK